MFSSHWLLQGHQIEVRSSGGGHIRGMGTIHGNVDMITSGDGVSTLYHYRSTRGQHCPTYQLFIVMVTEEV